MRDTLPLLERIPFPPLRRARLETLQVNLGYRCNQSCVHCHVNAGPNRTEQMAPETVAVVLDVLRARQIGELDITGGAPELHPDFRRLVRGARSLGVTVTDRCNLTILARVRAGGLGRVSQPANASRSSRRCPAICEDNVERQRGKGVFEASLRALQQIERARLRDAASRSISSTIRKALRCRRRRRHSKRITSARSGGYGIVFNRLFVLANMPIQRFGSMLVSKGEFERYLGLLQDAISTPISTP